MACFVFTPQVWQHFGWSYSKVELIRRRLLALKNELAQLNIQLLLASAESFEEAASVVGQLAIDLQASHVHFNNEYEIDEQARDQRFCQLLSEQNAIKVQRYDDGVLLPPKTIVKKDGSCYLVFTPFKNAFYRYLETNWPQVLSKPEPCDNQANVTLNQLTNLAFNTNIPEQICGFEQSHSANSALTEQALVYQLATKQSEILHQLRQFCQEKAADYKISRDLPAVDGTSQLSANLAIGALSVRQCINRLRLEAQDNIWQKGEGAETWFSELIWREFYQNLLVFFPEMCKHQPMQAYTKQIQWSENPMLFDAWCQGKTGYPIVDAAMRQLNQTGWMHNRLRMITASFLVKDLQIDWRLGEHYFMSKLIDGDFAANNGGWQWSASTGTDAAPYFRIFNPTSQSKKFDEQGEFIRQFVPELASLSDKAIHEPDHAIRKHLNYPLPIVEHKLAREKTLAMFKSAKVG